MKYTLLLSLLLLSIGIHAQISNSKEKINSGIKYYDNEEYRNAIICYDQINQNDSSYQWALAEKAMAYLAMDLYDSAIFVCNKALELDGQCKQHLMRSLGTAYYNKGDINKSIKIYEDALLKYPYSSLLHFNLAVTYHNCDSIQKAILHYQEALRANPFHASSHMQLGKLMARQKQYTKAILSLETFLALEPNSKRSNDILIYLENICGNYLDTTYGKNLDPIIENALFEKTDHYIKSKIVFSERYPYTIDFKANLVKQTQMLFDVLPLELSVDDFWVNMYFPFYNEIKKGQHIVPFLYTILQSTNKDIVNEYNKKKTEELKAFYATGNQLSIIKKVRKVNIEGKNQSYTFDYFDSGELYSIGNYNNQNQKEGDWKYYYSNGEMQAQGNFSKDKKEGVWKYYDDYGNITSLETLSQGILSGSYYDYYSNGNKRLNVNYDMGEINSIVTWYDEFGSISEQTEFRNSTRNGLGKTFYPDGQVKDSIRYNNGNYSGLYYSYFPNGNQKTIEPYTDGVLDGKYVEKFENGQIENLGAFNKGAKDGDWQYYYKNGTPAQKATFKNGLIIGQLINYQHNGQIDDEQNYNTLGILDGKADYYNNEGKLYLYEIYKDGIIIELGSMNQSGSTYKNFGDSKGSFKFITYDLHGRKAIEGSYSLGKKNGNWISYYKSGAIRTKLNYKDGKLSDTYIEYYSNGQIKKQLSYNDGQLDGVYSEYFKNGSIKTKGFYLNNNIHETWTTYLINGSKKEEYYYQNGHLFGWNESFSPDGKVFSKTKYLNDKIIEFQEFDSLETLINDINFFERDKFVKSNKQKDTLASSSIKGGYFYGDFIWYYPNGKVSFKKGNFLGKGEGAYTGYYRDGSVYVSGIESNGNDYGHRDGYYINGKLKYTDNYIDNEKDSICIFYYPNGNIQVSENYKLGKLHGDVLHYSYNGELMIKMIYDEDELIAYQYYKGDKLCDTVYIDQKNYVVEAYYSNGQKSYILHLENGIPHGANLEYSYEGKIIKSYNYSNGELDGLCTINYSDGKPYKRFICKDGLNEGPYETYYESGILNEIINYKSDEFDGLTKYFDKNGELQSTERYWNGRFIEFVN